VTAAATTLLSTTNLSQIASAVGSLLLLLIGVAFLCAALVGWWRAGEDPSSRRRHLVAVVVDLLVGVAALGDGAVSVLGEPERVVVWSIGSAALVVAVAALSDVLDGRGTGEVAFLGQRDQIPELPQFHKHRL